jgi:hypothetical protein
MPQEKPKEERLKEGVTMIKKLKQVGISPEDSGFQSIQKAVSEWVKTGEEFKDVIPFARYDRNAHIVLPKYVGSSASIVLKVIDASAYET